MRSAKLTRDHLSKLAIQALDNHKHVLVFGPYGIGKTFFALKTLQGNGGPRLVLSLGSGPKEMAETLLDQISRHSGTPKAELRTFNGMKRRLRCFYKEKYIVVIDDFFAVSTAKLGFLHFLIQSGFRLIVIVENGVKETSLNGMMKFIPLAHRIDLPRLSKTESHEMIVDFCQKKKIPLDENKIKNWIIQFQGYPLMIFDYFWWKETSRVPQDQKAE